MLSEVIDNLVDPYFQTIKLSRSCTRITYIHCHIHLSKTPMTIFKNQKPNQKNTPFNKYICILTNRNPSPSTQLGLCLSFLHHLALLSQLVFFQGGSPVSSMAILQAPRIWENHTWDTFGEDATVKVCQSWHETMLSLQRCHSDKKTRLYYRSAIQDKHEHIIMIWCLISKKCYLNVYI